MKRSMLTILMVIPIVLSSLGSSPVAAAQETASVQVNTLSELASTIGQNAGINDSARVEYQFLMGTIRLEGTKLAVTKKQAKVLLPLWQQLLALSQNMAAGRWQGNGAQGGNPFNVDIQNKIDALMQKIEAAMTSAQIKAINNMQIAPALQYAQTLCGTTGASNNQQSQQGANPAGNGQQPQQGLPPAGGTLTPQPTITPRPTITPSATTTYLPGNGQPAQQNTCQTGGSYVSSQTIGQLIQILQTRIYGTPTPAQIPNQQGPIPPGPTPTPQS